MNIQDLFEKLYKNNKSHYAKHNKEIIIKRKFYY
jgi:hypothetical protein